ncbi:MAG: hypothetical protein E7486_00585 [Ruminococcaceae bacterium]|nr:hypothetical protein [Oscillospiraceae bacterium]
MGGLREKLIRFMYGRYGVDQLYYCLFGIAVALIVVNLFVGSLVITLLELGLIVYAYFRVFSRNTYRRSRENQAFLRVWNPVRQWFKRTVRRIKEIKTKRYRKCPGCKMVLRLPRKVGEHRVCCPRCKNVFHVKIRF